MSEKIQNRDAPLPVDDKPEVGVSLADTDLLLVYNSQAEAIRAADEMLRGTGTAWNVKVALPAAAVSLPPMPDFFPPHSLALQGVEAVQKYIDVSLNAIRQRTETELPRWSTTADPEQGLHLFAQVAELDRATAALAAEDTQLALEQIAAVREALLESVPPVRVSVAAQFLGLSRRTVDAWVDAGLLTLTQAPGSSVKVLDPARLHQVKTLVDELRAAGKKRGLADAIWYRLQDQELLQSQDLHTALEQMRQGDGVSLAEYRQQADSEDDGAQG